MYRIIQITIFINIIKYITMLILIKNNIIYFFCFSIDTYKNKKKKKEAS